MVSYPFLRSYGLVVTSKLLRRYLTVDNTYRQDRDDSSVYFSFVSAHDIHAWRKEQEKYSHKREENGQTIHEFSKQTKSSQ